MNKNFYQTQQDAELGWKLRYVSAATTDTSTTTTTSRGIEGQWMTFLKYFCTLQWAMWVSIMKLLQTPLQNHNSNEEISVVGMGMGGDLTSEACEELHLIVNFSPKLPSPNTALTCGAKKWKRV